MIFMLFVIAVILVILTWQVAADCRQIRRTVIAASDLNLEAHQRLLAHFEELERQKALEAHREWLRTK